MPQQKDAALMPHVVRNINAISRSARRRACYIVEQSRKELAHIAWRIEMTIDALGAASDRECKTVHLRHDREHALIGDVVADEERTPSCEGRAFHESAHAIGLGEAGRLDLEHA